MPDNDSQQSFLSQAGDAMRDLGMRLATRGGPSGLVTSPTTRRALWLLFILVCCLILLLVLLIGAVIAFLFGVTPSQDGKEVIKKYVDLTKTASICDPNGENCSATLTGVKGEKLIKYEVKLTPKVPSLKDVKVEDIFTKGKDKLQAGSLKAEYKVEPSSNVKNCSGEPTLDNICFSIDLLTAPAVFNVTVKTKPDLTESDLIVNEAVVSGLAEAPTSSLNSGCKFGPSKLPIRSKRLAAIMSEAAAASGVPVEVIASIAAHELGDFFYNADDNHDVFTTGFNMPYHRSSAGAIGIMQVSPPSRPSQYCASCVQKAAELMGVKYEDIANDKAFEDVRTNVYIGVGYLIGKMAIQGGDWNDLNAINAAAGYYHGSGPGGSYANSVSADVAACRALGPATGSLSGVGNASSCPLDTKASVTSGTKANPSNGSGHCGANYPTATSPWCSASRVRDAGYISAVYAIDITPDDQSPNHTVYLPKVEDQDVTWTFKVSGDADGLGQFADFEGIGQNGTKYYTHIVHLRLLGLRAGQQFASGAQIGQLYDLNRIGAGAPHVHITIARNSGNGLEPMDPPMSYSACR